MRRASAISRRAGLCVWAAAAVVALSPEDVRAQLIPPTERSRALNRADTGPPSVAGVHVEVAEQYYDVDAATLGEVVDILNTTRIGGPDAPRSQGLTEYRIRPEWSASASGGRCHVVNAEVFVDITITLPRWPVVFDRPASEREGWAEIDGAIREHEYAHRDLTITAAANVLERLKELDARGCVVLRRVVASTLSVADERLEAEHVALDESTPLRLSVGRRGGG